MTAGGAFMGRDQVIQGATPEQFADMLTRLLGLMVEIPQARNLLLGARTMLENARLQLRRMAEYKEAHDLLQQLESSYGVISSLICNERGLLPPGQVPSAAWNAAVMTWAAVSNACATPRPRLRLPPTWPTAAPNWRKPRAISRAPFGTSIWPSWMPRSPKCTG